MDDFLIHIVDDDASIRASLSMLLKSVGMVCACHDSIPAFLAASKPDKAGCLLLDVRMPGVSGIQFLSQLDQHGIRLPVIIMTGHGDIPMSVQAMKAGAVDFLTKPFRDQELLDTVDIALRRDVERRARLGVLRAISDRYQGLTEREREIMRLVTNGRLNKQVAGDLNLSEITVKIHRSTLMKKMGARTLPDLVKMAEELRRATL